LTLLGYSAGARVACAAARAYRGRGSAIAGIGAVGAPGDEGGDKAETAVQVRTDGMRAAMKTIAAEEPEPTPGWPLDNLAGTQADMFALMLKTTASQPAVWQISSMCRPGPDDMRRERRTADLAGMLPVSFLAMWGLFAY
jgi:thioesterase domain-containing protein